MGICMSIRNPDGGNVGIINHLSIIAKVTINIKEEGIYQALIDHKLIELSGMSSKELDDYCNVFLNGRLIGIHKHPGLLYKIMRLLKLNSFINILTSIVWDTNNNEIYIFSDSGRIVRPIFVLRSDKSNDLIQGDYSRLKNWSKLIHGYMYNLNESVNRI